MQSLVLIARSELRARWVSLVLIGLLAGLTGGVLVGAGTVARRTATADERLAAATNADDVRSLIFGGTREATLAIGAEAIALPEVARGRVALGGIARLELSGIVYRSILVGPDNWGADVLSPVLSAGRLPRPDRADEVVVNEEATKSGPHDINLGDTYTLHLLTPEEYVAFDANTPLEGRAGDQEITIVGIVRLPGGPQELPPFIGTQALAAAHPQGIGGVGTAMVQLRPGADVGAYIDGVNNINAKRPTGLEKFAAISVLATAGESRAASNTSTHVLTTALLLLAAAGALAGAAAVAQAVVRHHAATANAQRVEAAMGLTAVQRAEARLLAALPAAALAAAVTAAIGLACGRIAPPGALRTVEPRPGWAPNVVYIVAATLIVPAALLALVGFSAKQTIGRAPPRGMRESRLVARVASLSGRPPSSLGLRFAVERPPGATGTSTRAAMATVAAGVAGLLAASVFSSSLDRLVHTPARYGFPADIVIADAGPDVAASFAADERFDTVIAGASAELLVDGRAATGMSQEAVIGQLRWELASGRPPATDDEIVIGTRMAKELHKGVGDEVDLQDVSGGHHRLTVVGVGVVPNYAGGGLGRSAALTDAKLREVAATTRFPDLALGVGPGISVDDLVTEFATRYEIEAATLPREVANLEQIDRIPLILAVFLMALCLATLGHAITMTARHRRRDLAIARALGFVPRQSATSVVVMALATAVSGLLVALPLGVLVGAFIWRRVAEGSALLGHVHYPWIALASVLPVGVATAAVLVAIPARRAARDRILYNLRPE